MTEAIFVPVRKLSIQSSVARCMMMLRSAQRRKKRELNSIYKAPGHLECRGENRNYALNRVFENLTLKLQNYVNHYNTNIL